MPTEFCSFLACCSFSASCVTALCLCLPHAKGMEVEETILLRMLAAQLLRRLHKDGVLSVASEISCSLSVLPSPGNSRKVSSFHQCSEVEKIFSFFTFAFEILPQSAMCMISFWGCRWQEMLDSLSILTFAFLSSASLTFCYCPVSD